MADIRFGTDGWRAAIAADFTYDAVRRLACGLARFIQNDPDRPNNVVVGYDRRFASEHFAAAAADTLASNGMNVLLTDRAIPTQLSSFAARETNSMALVVTASHNEWLDNGIKIKDVTGAPAEEHVLRLIESNIPDSAERLSKSSEQDLAIEDLTSVYAQRLRELVDIELISFFGGHFAVDAIHGCGAGWLPSLLPANGRLRLHEIRTERNPYFGGVNPEPILPHINALLSSVAESSADGGLAFDGDADRVGLVTESGVFVNQLQVYGLLYWHLLEDRGLAKPAVYTVTTTQMVPRLAEAFGTEAYETPVGFKFVGPRMREVGAIIGGEESGGFGFGFHIPERDGLLAALLLLEMRAQRRASFDQLLAELQARFGPSEYSRIDVHFAREGYETVVRRTLDGIDRQIQSTLSSERVDRIDRLGENGFKVYLADRSWLMLRFSGTEPALRIYAEGPSMERVTELLEKGRVLAS